MSERAVERRTVTDVDVACRTDIGNHHRVNQDAGGAWAFARADGEGAALLVVADGVSAGRHSEEASRLAVSILRDRLAPVLEAPAIDLHESRGSLVRAIEAANALIAQRPHTEVTSADSTTVVAAALLGGSLVGAWVGDSRIYLVRRDSATRLTTDHSWAEGVVSRGLMTVDQAAADSRAHVIMRWLGPPQDRDVGIETFETAVVDGDLVLCCTDGLYMYFAPPYGSEDEIAHVLSQEAELGRALETLVEIALRRGGYDNITVAALRVSGATSSDRITDEVPIVDPGAPFQ